MIHRTAQRFILKTLISNLQFSTHKPKSSKISNLSHNISNRIKNEAKNQTKGKDSYQTVLNDASTSKIVREQNRIRKETENMEVTSEAQLEEEVVLAEIRRQREIVDNEEIILDEEISSIEKFMIRLAGFNCVSVGVLSLPFIQNNAYWLGVYSTSIMYPSFLAINCAMVGINLSYLILRHSLRMNTEIKDLVPNKIKTENVLTNSHWGTWMEMGILAAQVFSIAGLVGLNLLSTLNEPIRSIFTYSGLFILFFSNIHSTIQQQNFKNKNYHTMKNTVSFISILALSLFVNLYWGDNKREGKVEEKIEKNQFVEGQKWVGNVWKIERSFVDTKVKITDVLDEGVAEVKV